MAINLRDYYEGRGMRVGWDAKSGNVTINGQVMTPELLNGIGFQLNDGRWQTSNSNNLQVTNNLLPKVNPPIKEPMREIAGGGIANPVATPNTALSATGPIYNNPQVNLDSIQQYIPAPAPAPTIPDLGTITPQPEPVIPTPDPEPVGGTGKSFEEEKPKGKKDKDKDKIRTPINESPVQNTFGQILHPSNAAIMAGRGGFLSPT